MTKDAYKETCNFFSEILQKMFTTMAATLGKNDIHLMVIAHLLFVHPGIEDFKSATLAMGDENILLKMPEQLKADLIENFKKIEEENFRKDVVAGFRTLENKKNIIH